MARNAAVDPVKAKLWWNSLHLGLFSAALFGIFVVLYLLILPLDRRFDVTREKRFTVSEETKNVLQTVTKPIQISVFYHVDQRNQVDAVSELLKSYQALNKLLHFELVELDREPMKAFKLGVGNYGEIVLEQESRKERIWDWTEESLTKAILRLRSDSSEYIYFTEGHGELSLDADERRGLLRLKERLTEENYEPLPCMLSEAKEVPGNAAVLFVVSPKTDFYEEEIEKLEAYLARGGSLVVFLDPLADEKITLLESFLSKYGILAGQDVVIDEKSKSYGADSVIATIERFGEHPVTKGVHGEVILPLARSMRPTAASVKLTDLTVVAATSPVSWAETNLKKLEEGTAKYDEEDGQIGMVPVGVVAEGRATAVNIISGRETYRILAVGDSDFVTNALIQFGAHQAFISSSLGWLAHRNVLLTIPQKAAQPTPLYLSVSDQRKLFLSVVVFIPLLTLLAGVFVHFKRFHPISKTS